MCENFNIFIPFKNNLNFPIKFTKTNTTEYVIYVMDYKNKQRMNSGTGSL
jgi:hypothetical protein